MERNSGAPLPQPNAKAPAAVPASKPELKGFERAAVLMVALGPEAAGKVLKCLSDREVEKISVAISRFQNVSSEVIEEVLVDYKDLEMAQSFLAQGGPSFARQALEAAVGAGRAEEVMMKVEASMEISAFHLLQTLETSQLTSFFQNEHPQTAALILAHLNPRKAADVITGLGPELQHEIMYRLATMGKTSPEFLRDIEDVIRQQIGSVFGADLSATGGIEAVAEILGNANRGAERSIMDAIQARDEGLANSIKGLMFVFDDLVHVSNRDLQRLLADVDQRDLALALRAASEELKGKVLGNVSERAAAAIREEMELAGPVRVSDVEEAQRAVIQVAQALEEQEEIMLTRSAEEML